GWARRQLLSAGEPLNSAARILACSAEEFCKAGPALEPASKPKNCLARGGSAQALRALAQTGFFMAAQRPTVSKTTGGVGRCCGAFNFVNKPRQKPEP